MFKIEDGREHFWQWDTNQRLIIEDSSITEVHFCNKTDDCSLVCEVYEEDGVMLVNVPNILLQDSWSIRVYAYCTDHTKIEEIFKVTARSKPADYIYTETEILNYNTLLERIDNIDENIGEAVSDYLTENPIEVDLSAYATMDYVDNAVNSVDLSGYALKSEIPDVSGFITEIPDEYVTETELENGLENYTTKDYVSNALTPYAKTEDIPDVSGYALKTEIPVVPTNISAFTNDAGYLTEHQDLSDYALKTEIPDVSGYQTETQVQALIDTAIASITDGEAVSY